jgi:hypothetical protein
MYLFTYLLCIFSFLIYYVISICKFQKNLIE